MLFHIFSDEEIINFFLGFLFPSDFRIDYGIVPTNPNTLQKNYFKESRLELSYLNDKKQ